MRFSGGKPGEERVYEALILLKTLLLGEKDFFGKEALLHFEEMCQKGVSELHPQCLR